MCVQTGFVPYMRLQRCVTMRLGPQLDRVVPEVEPLSVSHEPVVQERVADPWADLARVFLEYSGRWKDES